MATTKHVETVVDSHGKSREIEVFVFQNPRKRKTEKMTETELPQQQYSSLQQSGVKATMKQITSGFTMDLERARSDVRNFSIAHMEGKTKIEAQFSQLKRLGAEIPKNWERKLEKRRRKEESDRRIQDLKAGLKTKKVLDHKQSLQRSEAEKKKKKKEKEDKVMDGQIGKYMNGVQFISAADIKRVRSSGKKRKV